MAKQKIILTFYWCDYAYNNKSLVLQNINYTQKYIKYLLYNLFQKMK